MTHITSICPYPDQMEREVLQEKVPTLTHQDEERIKLYFQMSLPSNLTLQRLIEQ